MLGFGCVNNILAGMTIRLGMLNTQYSMINIQRKNVELLLYCVPAAVILFSPGCVSPFNSITLLNKLSKSSKAILT